MAGSRCQEAHAPRPEYPTTYEQQEAKNKAFIESISRDAVCELASRHRGGTPCRIFDVANGSFNACFFIEFPDDGSRWVVRIPIDCAVHDVWVRLQSEVATLRYIKRKTSIPVPCVHAFGHGETLTCDSSTTQAYLILDYVPGQSLDAQSLAKDTRERRDHFYRQLIGILAQMRSLEFPLAGSLMLNPDGDQEPLVGPLSSIHINEMQLQGSQTVKPKAPFKSATDFIFHQLKVMEEAYQLPMSEQSLETAQAELFALQQLKKELSEFTGGLCWDAGPFVLSHLDLRWPNIIVDDALSIIAIIDWEWTATIPRELFTPPSWIAGKDPAYVAGKEFCAEYSHFRNVLLSLTETSPAVCRLADEWAPDLPDRSALPIAELLRHHAELKAIFYRTLYPKLSKAPRKDFLEEFFAAEENRELALEAKRRFEHSERYTQYLKENNLFTPSKTAEALRQWETINEKLQKLLKEIEAGPPSSRKNAA